MALIHATHINIVAHRRCNSITPWQPKNCSVMAQQHNTMHTIKSMSSVMTRPTYIFYFCLLFTNIPCTSCLLLLLLLCFRLHVIPLQQFVVTLFLLRWCVRSGWIEMFLCTCAVHFIFENSFQPSPHHFLKRLCWAAIVKKRICF